MKNLPQIMPVFPLEGAVMFPNTYLPLNIFEPRYLKMIDYSMSQKNRLIGRIQPKISTDKNKNVDLAIFNAAVADYRVENYQKQKIKRNKNLTLKLKNNPDILKTISNISSGPQITVGFAYETNDVKVNALKKLKKKNCDYLVLNYPISKNNIFNNKYNNGGIFNKKGHYHQIGNVTKTSFANQVLRHILKVENE